MITWKLGTLDGFPLVSGGYKNIHTGHFIDEDGNEYDEKGVFVQNVKDEDEYKD